MISGSGYQLTTVTWQVISTVSGGSYLLQGFTEAGVNAGGCCCIFLPCMMR